MILIRVVPSLQGAAGTPGLDVSLVRNEKAVKSSVEMLFERLPCISRIVIPNVSSTSVANCFDGFPSLHSI